ncbi:MAG: metallophosphoesterase family protein [Verrucomicrobiota bacterium]
MKYGLFGDIHSNLEALEAVLEDMFAKGVEQMICLGDVVGYNANPSECLKMVRSLKCPIVKGNHDEEASEDRDISHFNPLALESLNYSRKQLSSEQKTFLRALPLQLSIANFTVVHASLDVPARWDYIFTVDEAARSFTYQRTQVCFCGHTHVPKVFIQDGEKIFDFPFEKTELCVEKKYLFNVGSVGQPRDGDWRTAYALFDTELNTIELQRVPYEVVKTQQKILNAGLPTRLAERLANAV